MAYQTTKRQPLILIAIVTALAGVLYYLFGAYGVIGAGVLGLCATFSLKGGVEGEGFLVRDPEMFEQATEQADLKFKDLVRSWIPKAMEAGYSIALIILGFILADAQYAKDESTKNTPEVQNAREADIQKDEENLTGQTTLWLEGRPNAGLPSHVYAFVPRFDWRSTDSSNTAIGSRCSSGVIKLTSTSSLKCGSFSRIG